ncbi:MAG: hypothetical protein LUP96_07365, partial [Methylococcaceae bacterium]|nr:hypothetical protein [Methylococcaceae bacterium]
TVIFFFGSRDELNILLKTAEAVKPKPYIFISSALTGASIVNKEFADKIFLSSPVSPQEQANATEFFQLIKRNNLSTQHLTTQAVSYSAAKLLVEGLQKTGRELSRKKLIHNLETIYRFDTGLLPLLSYGSNRHIGSAEVSIVPLSQ